MNASYSSSRLLVSALGAAAFLSWQPLRAAESIEDLKPRPGLKPFEYTEAPDRLPNYVPGAKWGTLAEPIRTMQKPLSPEESALHLVLRPGFEAKLFAAEPDVAKPICLAWDERGRLWVAETFDYPNELQKPGEGRDRIKICEDTDGDGRADKFTVFAEKLSIPTSIVFANGGLLVSQAPDTLFLKDTNGDDQADVRQVLFTGWGVNDTHAGPSNLRRGLDNWIWGTVGYSGFDGTVGGRRLRFGQGVFRFKPDGSMLEFIKSSNNNTWGLGLSEEGIIFGSTANNNASWYMPIPNRCYEEVNGWSASRMETIADSQLFYPLNEKVRQVDWHQKYTAGAGHALYTARSFPKNYWNRIAFVTEPTGHLIGQFDLQGSGADFTAKNLHSFLASDDEWTAPIAAEVGPDGALWMIDWYNYIVQHNPTPQGFKTGKGNAYETPLRDKRHGRIYRVTHTASKPGVAPARLDRATTPQLVAALKSDNQLWRLHAQRLLVERRAMETVPALLDLIRNPQMDELGLNPAAIHALWVLQGLYNTFEVVGAEPAVITILSAMKHPSAGVRRAAVGVAPRSAQARDALLANGLLNDPDAQVKLAALLAFSEMPADEASGHAIFAFLQKPDHAADRWLRDGATCAAARHDAGFLKASLGGGALGKEGFEVLRRVTSHYAHRGPADSVVGTMAKLKGASPTVVGPFLDGLLAGWPKGAAPIFSAKDRATLTGLMKTLPESERDGLLLLARTWGLGELFADQSVAITRSLHAQLQNGSLPDEQRAAAAQRLIRLSDEPDTLKAVLRPVGLLASPTLTSGLINALGESRHAEAGRSLLARWPQLTPAARRAAIATLLRRTEWTSALLDAVEKGELKRNDLALESWQQLKVNPNRPLAARAQRLSAGGEVISADRQEVLQKLLPVAKLKGDAARGHEVFKAACANCHVINGEGAKIGPELTGIGARDRVDILTEILDPNRSVEANYRLWTVTTKDGETFSGRLEAETQTSVEILDLTSRKHAVQRKDIASLEASSLSIMPSGFESLPEKDLAALLEFLAASDHGPAAAKK